MKQFFYFIVAFVCSSLNAQDISIFSSDRPGQALSASVLGKSSFQLQSGLDYFNNGEFLILNSYARYGIREGVELNVNAGYDFDFTQLSVFELGTRIALNKKEANRKIQSALQLSINLPISTLEFGSQAIITFAGNFSENYSWTTTFGSLFNKDFNMSTLYAFNVSRSLNRRLGVFIEIFGNVSPTTNLSWDTGCYYAFSNQLQFDFFIGQNNGFFSSLGFTYKPKGKN